MSRPIMSSRVGLLKWLGALQLVHGLLLFVLLIPYFSIDFHETSDILNIAANRYSVHILVTIPTVLTSIGAGAAGCTMSRYKGLIHNISTRNTAVVVTVMNIFSILLTLAVSGTHVFYDVDKRDVLDDGASWEKAVVALIIISFIVAFFNLLVDCGFLTLALLWSPTEPDSHEVKRSSRYAKESYYRGPEPDIVDTYVPSGRSNGYQGNYPASGYGGYYPASGYPYSAGSRTLPALKY